MLDESGVQLTCLMIIAGTSLKELLDQGRFFLLQLGDALTLVSHLLDGTEENAAQEENTTICCAAGAGT